MTLDPKSAADLLRVAALAFVRVVLPVAFLAFVGLSACQPAATPLPTPVIVVRSRAALPIAIVDRRSKVTYKNLGPASYPGPTPTEAAYPGPAQGDDR